MRNKRFTFRVSGFTFASAKRHVSRKRATCNVKRETSGFTLVEVLATVVLMAIVLPVAMRGIGLATKVAGVAEHRAVAAQLAQSKLHELLATSGWQSGTLNGDFSPDQPAYKWRAEMQAWDGSSIEEFDVHVLWTVNGREEQVTLSTLVDTS